MPHTVIVDQVTKRFGKQIVLKQVSLKIKKSEIYGLIGPSGAGKTTLVKLIVGMEKADEGQITVLDKVMPNLGLLQEIGYMSQSDALYSELTGYENLQFFASLFGLSRSAQKARIAYSAKLVNLSPDMRKKVSNYSGGMKRRLSLAIALIQNPRILVLDEPTVGIDPELSYIIWKELYRLKNEEQKTIIITTHVMEEAEKCDQLAMIREGVILTSGTASEMKVAFDAASLEEVFMKAGGHHL